MARRIKVIHIWALILVGAVGGVAMYFAGIPKPVAVVVSSLVAALAAVYVGRQSQTPP